MKKLPIFRKKLSNGLDAILIKKGTLPSVSINLTYKVGSQNETYGRRGFAHLFEHLMFEGSMNLPKGDFDKYCSLAGGKNNAYTSYDWTSFIMTLPSNQLELALWLESERMFNFEIKPESLSNQQNVVSEEIRQVVDNRPYGKWRELLAESAFHKDCTYSWEVHGAIDDVQNATMNDVLDFKSKYYVTNNASLVIAGDIEPDNAFELIEKYFSADTNRADIVTPIFKDSYKIGGKSAEYQDKVPFDATFIGFHTPGLKKQEHHINKIVSNIIGQGKSSMLNNSLVYKNKIATFSSAFPDLREHTSLLTFYAISGKREVNSDILFDAIIEQIEKFKKGEFDKEVFTKTRNQLKMENAYDQMYSSEIADNVGKMAMLYDQPERAFTIQDELDKISLEDAVDFANKYLTIDNSVRVSVLHDEALA